MSALLSGRTLGEFVVRELLGEGGFGAIYRAEQPLLGREAVIKILHARHGSSPEAIERFLREVKLLSRFDHPFAAHVYAFGVERDGLRWIAMELVRGTPLDVLLADSGPLSLARFVPLLERICEVLASAHEQGIVHRDIKPANLMVISRAGRLSPKLLDFGIAKITDERSATGAAPLPARELPDEALADGATLDVSALGALDGEAALLLPSPPGVSPLTQHGAAVGSPHYMAPEQWTSAAEVDRRTDIYALGCLCFEALTGRPPFDEASLMRLAAAHARKPPPTLGERFPRELDGVIARAMAKRRDGRYSSALELAAAFRAAAGISVEREALPQLDEELRARVEGGAPQPLAEAVVALAQAENAHQARGALTRVVRVAAHLLGVYALGCRTRIGAPATGDSPAVKEALRALRKRGLVDEEWVQLARELVRPFAARRDVHPLPELVSLFFGAAPDPFAALFDLDRVTRSTGAGATREALSAALPHLASLLGSLRFLDDYALAVPHGETAARWMGVRRPRRTTVVTTGLPLAAGQVVLLDAANAPLVELSPLAQIARPSQGAPEELFFVEGPGLRGARLAAPPMEFERSDPELWEWFGERLLSDDSGAGPTRGEERSPWRGLAPFQAADAADFVGREREAEAFANRLRVEPLLAVVGPSGAGKSSFVQAGVVPLLPPSWHVVTLRPGPTPLGALAARLERDGIPGGSLLRAALRTDPKLLGETLRLRAASEGSHVVLVVDQLEELITLCGDPEERSLFARALGEAARSSDDPVRVVVTLRDDFLIRAQQLAGLRERLGVGLQLLGTPAPDELRRILVEPARRAGYELEDAALADEMVAEVAELPGALALLSFTASKLWELRDRHFRQLPRKTYRAMGGVGGALAQHADRTLASLPVDEQRVVREAFRHLVTSEGTRAVLSRAELSQLLGASGETVVEKLVGARLLQASEGDGEERIEAVHEALIAAWPRLAEWRREDAEGARMRDQIRAAARQWSERGRPRGLLWRDDALAEYQLWRARSPRQLTDVEEAFARASVDDAARGRRRRRTALGAVIATLTVGVLATATLYRRAESARAVADERLLDLYEEQGRQLSLAGEPLRAAAYLGQAFAGGRDDGGLRFLLGRIGDAMARRRALLRHSDDVIDLDFSPDGRALLTASSDGTAALWDAATGKRRASFAHRDRVIVARFARSAARIVTASSDGEVRVATAEGASVGSFHEPGLRSAEILRDGSAVVTAGASAVHLWSAEGRPLQTFATPHVVYAAPSPDGTRVAISTDEGWIDIRSLATGALLTRFRAHDGFIFCLRWSADGALLATTAQDRRAQIFRSDGSRVASLDPGGQAMVWIDFSPDGQRVVTASLDGTARTWSLDGKPLQLFAGHRGPLRHAAFSPDGRLLLTASADTTARLWDATTGRALATMSGHLDRVWRASFSPDGATAATASADGTAALWRVDATQPRARLADHRGEVLSVIVSSDGKRLLTVGDDRTARAWELDGLRLAQQLPLPGPLAVWMRDGRALVAADERGALLHAPDGEMRLAAPPPVALAAGHMRVALASGDGKTRVFGSDGALLTTVDSPGASCAALSRDDALLAVGGVDKLVRLFSLPSGHLTHTLRGHRLMVNGVAFSRDGALLVSASDDKSARVWSATSGAPLAVLDGHTEQVAAAAFDPTGTIIATTSADGDVRFWDRGEGRLLSSAINHQGIPYAVDFSPDGALAATAGQDGAVLLWNARPFAGDKAVVASWLRCRVPYRLAGGQLQVLPSESTAESATCAALFTTR